MINAIYFNKMLFPKLQNNSKYELPNSIGKYIALIKNPKTKQQLQNNYVMDQTKTILKTIPSDMQNDLSKLCSLVGADKLENQLEFFRNTAKLAQQYPQAEIYIWGQELQADEQKIPCPKNSKYESHYDIHQREHKELGKINVIEKHIPEIQQTSNIEVATTVDEMQKNLFSYGEFGAVIQNLEFPNKTNNSKTSLNCIISKNNLPHTDPIWNNKRYRSGGDDTSPQHNYLCNVFEYYPSIAISKNSVYATNAPQTIKKKKSRIEKMAEKIVLPKEIPRRKSRTNESEKYDEQIDKNMRECFLDEKLMDGTFIAYLNNDSWEPQEKKQSKILEGLIDFNFYIGDKICDCLDATLGKLCDGIYSK